MATTSVNMSLPIPTVGVDAGPQWATLLDACLTIVDGHSHNPGSGVPITPTGLNINTDLPIGNNNVTGLRSLRFTSNPSTLALAADRGCLYEVNNDLYYNDGAGTQIRFTNGGAIVGSPGTITGITGTASAVYSGASSTYVWQSATVTAANMDFGAAVMRNVSPNSTYALTLSPPANLGANYALTLPPANASGSTRVLSLSTSGVIASGVPNIIVAADLGAQSVTNAALGALSVTNDKIATGTIIESNMAANSIGTAELINGSVTLAKQAAASYTLSGSSGGFSTTSVGPIAVTNLNCTIVSTGKPILVTLIPDGSTINASYIVGHNPNPNLAIFRDGSIIALINIATDTGAIPPGSITFLDTGAAAGSRNYVIQVYPDTGTTVIVAYCKLLVREF